MKLETVRLKQSFQTISWLGDDVVDWSKAGMLCSLSGETRQLNTYHFGFNFNRAINSEDGVYAFIYQALGTKGLLIKNGEPLREINRSYYHSTAYEFPAQFLEKGGKTYLVHCPIEYSRLEFENVETGEIVTESRNRKTFDIFHSRLEISSNGEYLLSKGWIWHPTNVIQIFKIGDCLLDPNLLDAVDTDKPKVGREINTATFVNNREILIGTSDEEAFDDEAVELMPAKSIAIWNLESNTISKLATPSYPFGNIFGIRDRLAWDIYGFPKVIDIDTGELVLKDESINTGKQCSSIIHHIKNKQSIVFNASRTRMAIMGEDGATTVVSLV